jgi:hypothetical protein
MSTGWKWVLVLLVLVALIVGSCVLLRDRPVSAFTQASAIADEENCPHYWDRFTTNGVTDTVAPVSGETVSIPEYHDCQRLTAPSAPRYGALVAVFAASYLTRLPDTLLYESAQRGGAVVGVAAATLVPMDAPFADLGIERSSTVKSACLYMWNDGQWRARMVPVGDYGRACTRPLDPSQPVGMPLQVDTTTDEGLGGFEHAPVARFERSTTGFYVALRCGRKWCSIGRPGFQRAPAFTPDVAGLDSWLPTLPGNHDLYPVTAQNLLDLSQVRGWFDDLYLAPPGGGDRPSALWGAILPHPGLTGMPETAFNQWQVSGFVWLPPGTNESAGAISGYRSRFNFESGWNAIALCNPAAPESNGCVQGVTVEQRCADRPLQTGQQLWYASIQSRSGGAPKYYCVLRRTHPGMPMPPVIGTARWRWIQHDEWVWEGCGQGCCEVWRSDT